MKKYLLVLLIGFFITALPVWAESTREETMVFTTVLFGNDDDIPLNINSDKDWIDLSAIDSSTINELKKPDDGIVRRWRIKSSYSDSTVAGQSTIQVKLRTNGTKMPIFTLPWSEGRTGWKENYSNWFQTEFEGHLPLLGAMSVSSVRLIAPPGSSSPGMIYKIELEAWDTKEIETEENIQSIVQRASLNIIPEIKAINPEATEKNKRLERREPEADQALSFALNFINNSLNGDLPAFYSSLNETVYSLKTGNGDSKFRVTPPQNYYSGFSLSDYTERYETKIYGFSEYRDMFPQWLAEEKRWKPDRNSYLFHGSSLKEGKEAFLEDEILVFICKIIDEEWKLLAIPE